MKEIFRYFLRLGFVAFGGPAAHVAMMQEELVEQKKWLTTEEFLDYMGATNLIPGPNSTEMTMHCGYHRGGAMGLFVAGFSFIFPAVLLTLAVAVFFEKFSEITWVVPIINGIKAAVLSFIVGAILKLGKKAVKTKFLALIGVVVMVVSFLGVNEILCILAAGILVLLFHFATNRTELNSSIAPLLFFSAAAAIPYSKWKLFFIFLKVGAMRKSAALKAFLEAVNVAAVAVMVVVSVKMAESILLDWKTMIICAISFFVYFYFKKINTLWIIFGGAILGYGLSYV